MAKQDEGTQQSLMRRCGCVISIALVAGIALGTLLAGYLHETGNTCDSPNAQSQNIEGSQTASLILDEFQQRVDAALDRQHIDQGTWNEFDSLIRKARDPDLRNRLGKHVCHVQGPSACEELAEFQSSVKAASEAPNADDAKPLWDRALEGLRDFPSGQ